LNGLKYASNKGRKFFTGEATPTYIYHPHAPKRIKQLLPNVKLIVILRNPIERAFSHYNMSVRHGDEKLDFEEAIKEEDERISEEYEKMKINENYYSLKFQIFSYIRSGLYAEQLERWFDYFPKKQFLFIQSETFRKDIQLTFDTVFEFLNIKPWKVKKYQKYQDAIKNKTMYENTKNQLYDYFKPHNQKLYTLINQRFDWDNIE